MPFCHAHLKGPRPLPRSYPQVLTTIGDHLRKRRLDLGLLQRELAERLGVDPCTVTNWELSRSSPALRFVPAIIELLGFDPAPAGGSLGKRLQSCRRRLGWSQKRFAQLLGIDPGTFSRWERNVRIPTGRYLELAEIVLERFARQGPALTDLLPSNRPADVRRTTRETQEPA